MALTPILGDGILIEIASLEAAKEVWDYLANKYAPDSMGNYLSTLKALQKLEMSASFDAYLDEFTKLSVEYARTAPTHSQLTDEM